MGGLVTRCCATKIQHTLSLTHTHTHTHRGLERGVGQEGCRGEGQRGWRTERGVARGDREGVGGCDLQAGWVREDEKRRRESAVRRAVEGRAHRHKSNGRGKRTQHAPCCGDPRITAATGLLS